MYQLGRGAKNCTTAVEWYARGIPDPWSLFSLGRMDYFGSGVKEDRAKAHASYRQAAAFGDHRGRALATFNRFNFPDERSAAILDERSRRYVDAINACQAKADRAGHTITCLVPVVDLNPKTWRRDPLHLMQGGRRHRGELAALHDVRWHVLSSSWTVDRGLGAGSTAHTRLAAPTTRLALARRDGRGRKR